MSIEDLAQLRHAAELVITTQCPSERFLQRRLGVGYARAAALMDELEAGAVVGPPRGVNPREMLVAPADLAGVLAEIDAL